MQSVSLCWQGQELQTLSRGVRSRGCEVIPELLVGLQQVTQSVVKLLLLHEGATFLMETHGQDQSLTTHTHSGFFADAEG